MISHLNKLSSAKVPLSFQKIVLAANVWSLLALLFYLLFSVPIEVNGVSKRADWYVIGTYVFEQVAYLGATILCLRNWRSPTIISERNFWLGIGFGMLSYLLGNTILGYWELVLHQEPLVSPADLFFVGTYLFLTWSMLLAISSRRVNLERWQWAFVVGVGLTSIVLAIWFSSEETVNPQTPVGSASPLMSLLEESVKLFYIVGDILLLIIATMLLLAYWSGRFAQSWRMIAPAVFSLYIADMWLKYAENHINNYQSGALVEVFWVFSGVLFAVGAAVEYDISSRSRRVVRRRRA
jgi:hypothetical protein